MYRTDASRLRRALLYEFLQSALQNFRSERPFSGAPQSIHSDFLSDDMNIKFNKARTMGGLKYL